MGSSSQGDALGWYEAAPLALGTDGQQGESQQLLDWLGRAVARMRLTGFARALEFHAPRALRALEQFLSGV